MKKKILAVILSAAMIAAFTTGCATKQSEPTATVTPSTTASSSSESTSASSESTSSKDTSSESSSSKDTSSESTSSESTSSESSSSESSEDADEITVSSCEYRAFASPNNESSADDGSEYMLIFFTEDDTLIAILDESHFNKSAGYTADALKESLDPDDIYAGFNSALFTTLEIEDDDDYVAYLLWMENLNSMLNLATLEDMGVITFEEEGLYSSCKASTYCSSLIDLGFTEVSSSDIIDLELHTDHSEDPYYVSDPTSRILITPEAAEESSASASSESSDLEEAYYTYMMEENDIASAGDSISCWIDGTVFYSEYTLDNMTSEDITDEVVDNAFNNLTNSQSEPIAIIKAAAESLGTTETLYWVITYVTSDGTPVISVQYGTDDSFSRIE